MADRQAAALRTSAGADAVIAGQLGTTDVAGPVGDAPVEKLITIPTSVRDALTRNGVMSVQDLGAQAPDKIVEIARKEGLTVTAADAAEWAGTALTLSQLRLRR